MMLLICIGIVLIVMLITATHLLPEGDQVAFMSDRRGNWDIYVLDVNRRIAHPLTNDLANERYPVWSPDGKQIAYHANIGLDYDLYIMNDDGSAARVMGFDDDNNYYDEAMITWQPQGDAVIYHAGVQNSTDFHLYIGDLTTGDFYRVVDNLGDTIHADWSPDGKRLAFSARRILDPYDVNMTIYILELLPDFPNDGARAVRLTEPEIRAYFPVWSPDGKQIAFVVSSPGLTREDIYIMNSDGTGQRNLTADNTVINTHPEWLPDGRIIFTSNRDGDFDLYIMNADGSNVQHLTNEPGNEEAPDWRP